MTEKAQQEQLKAENAALRNHKRFLSSLAVLLPLLLAAAVGAGWQMMLARDQAAIAEAARVKEEAAKRQAQAAEQQAVTEAKRSAQLLQRLTNAEKAKRAFLTGDVAEIWRLAAAEANDATVKFGARRSPVGWKTGDGKPVYRYELFPLPESLIGPLKSATQISYYMNHSTFQTKLLTAGPPDGFTASYQGWGCLNKVYVLIEYADPERPPDVTWYDCLAALDAATH